MTVSEVNSVVSSSGRSPYLGIYQVNMTTAVSSNAMIPERRNSRLNMRAKLQHGRMDRFLQSVEQTYHHQPVDGYSHYREYDRRLMGIFRPVNKALVLIGILLCCSFGERHRTEDDLCADIRTQTVNNGKVICFNSPTRSGDSPVPVSMHKTITGPKTSYSVVLRGYGTNNYTDVKGVSILFEDGSKIVRPRGKLRTYERPNGIEYSAVVLLNDDEMKLLRTLRIAKYQLYIYDTDLKRSMAERLRGYASCIRHMHP